MSRDPRPQLLADLKRVNASVRYHRSRLVDTETHIARLTAYRAELVADLANFGLADTPAQVAALIDGA